MELSGKTAFITGCAQGLGKAIAEALLEKGVKVFLTDVNEKTGHETLTEFQGKFGSNNVQFMTLDVSNEKQFEEVFQAAISALGHVDLMVNNAGIGGEDIWQVVLRVNLFGMIKGTKLAEQHMRKDQGGKGGRIINMGSIAALGDSCCIPTYSATKHGVRSFTMGQAGQLDLKVKGIEYALLCPYFAQTSLISDIDDKKVFYLNALKPLLNGALSVSRVVEGFLHLVQLETMNGAILKVTKQEMTFQKMTAVDLGPDYVYGVMAPPGCGK